MTPSPHAHPEAPIRLIATDLDGTLLRTDGGISKRTRTVLASLRAHDIPLVMVSARPPRSLREIASRIGVEGIAIGCNGAVVYNTSTDSILDQWPLASKVATRLATDLRQRLPEACFAVEKSNSAGWERGYLAIRGRQPEPDDWIDDALTLCSAPVLKLLMRHPTLAADEMLAVGRSVAREDAIATHSGAPLLEISAPGVDKATALAALCARLDIAPSSVMAFGDMPNDIPMLRWAGHGVAVANAHEDVLAIADATTPSSNDDGVACALEALLASQNGYVSFTRGSWTP